VRGYAEIERIGKHWSIQMRATRLRNLNLLVYGILQSRSGSLSAIVWREEIRAQFVLVLEAAPLTLVVIGITAAPQGWDVMDVWQGKPWPLSGFAPETRICACFCRAATLSVRSM